MSAYELECCSSCGVGSSSTSQKVITQQVKKHGEYICEPCEKVWDQIVNTPKDEPIQIKNTLGNTIDALITIDNIYYFEGAKVANPESGFLGFGGSWAVVTKTTPLKYGSKREMVVTNNLWHSRSVPNCYRQKLEASGKVNAQITWVEKTAIAQFRDLLNKTPYLPDLEVSK